MRKLATAITLISFGFFHTGYCGWLDFLKPVTGTNSAAATASGLSEDQITQGLKEALGKGVKQAVAQLGKEDGFLKNPDVKIPMPEQLRAVEKSLRALKQDKLADEFVTTMNRAAEAAVPEAAGVFGDAITQMSVTDARSILAGPDDAATQYFRKTGETKLTEKLMPIVQAATQKAGVTAAYKNLMSHAGGLTSFLNQSAPDLDKYVTGKALDGLFKMVAAEEKQIRQNPVARSTDLLKKVFSTVTTTK